jgi:hypothetical protein
LGRSRILGLQVIYPSGFGKQVPSTYVADPDVAACCQRGFKFATGSFQFNPVSSSLFKLSSTIKNTLPPAVSIHCERFPFIYRNVKLSQAIFQTVFEALLRFMLRLTARTKLRLE